MRFDLLKNVQTPDGLQLDKNVHFSFSAVRIRVIEATVGKMTKIRHCLVSLIFFHCQVISFKIFNNSSTLSVLDFIVQS